MPDKRELRQPLRRLSQGHYATPDGRYEVSYEEWWLDGECECLMCQQGSECPNGGAGRRDGWTVWDTVTENHLSGEPFEFETLRDARAYLDHHLARTTNA